MACGPARARSPGRIEQRVSHMFAGAPAVSGTGRALAGFAPTGRVGDDDGQGGHRADDDGVDERFQQGDQALAGGVLGLDRGVAIGAEPSPASLENAARLKPMISAPSTPPAPPCGLKAPSMIVPIAAGTSVTLTRMTTRQAAM